MSATQSRRNSNRRIAGAVVFVICVSPVLRGAEGPLSGRDVLYFDAGPVGPALADGALALKLETAYSPELGFGWVRSPREGFDRRELVKSRSAMTMDGVTGSQIGFRADVEPGMWYLTLWLETEETNLNSPRVLVQGQQLPLRWQVFRPQAEPRRTRSKQYRVFHRAIQASSGGLRCDLSSMHDDVRLLGISLIRQSKPTEAEHRKFIATVEAVGKYQNNRSLNELLLQAESAVATHPNDAFFAIWRQRLDLLVTAERYYSMRGWQWADKETELGIFDRQPQAVMLLDAFLMEKPLESKQLVERAMYFRSRLLYWMAKERGGVRESDAAARDLNALAAQHPEDKILAMYTGKRVDLPDACDCLSPTTAAPDWSNTEREALCRLRLLICWWIEHRQNGNGELGGKFGDDVEMLRWWAPLCLIGDETALRGWKRLADGVWNSKHVFRGYAAKVADVEHAAEFVADTMPLMLLYDDDPRYEQRLAKSAGLFETLWTGISTGGNRHFRSAWFSSTMVDTEAPKGRDVEYNTRAAQTLRYLVWRRPDPRRVRLLHEWSTAWVAAAMGTDKGKPRGIIPASVRYPDDAINGDGPNWYESDMFWDYYNWEHYAGSLMLDQLLFTYTLTGDENLLQPIFLALDLIRSESPGLIQKESVSLRDGSPTWAADRLIRSTQFWSVVEQWRTISGDSRWDDLIMMYGTPQGRFRISGEERHLLEGINQLLADVRYNTPLKTTEAVYTDRVRVPGTELLKLMLTGDGMQDNLSPYYAVTWQQTDSDFTALVRTTGSEQLEVDLYSHGRMDRGVLMRVWQLVPGRYELLGEAQGLPRQVEHVTVLGPGQRIPITLPSRRLMHVALRRTP